MESVLCCLSRGRGFLLNFLCPNLQLTHLGNAQQVDTACTPCGAGSLNQRVEGTLLALVSRGWVSMGLGLKARQHRGPKKPSPVPTPTSTHRPPQGSLPWVPDSSGAPPRVALRSDSLLERHR